MRLADRFAELAAVLVPSARRAWAEAMSREIRAIDDPGEATAFALGCLRAAAVEGGLSMIQTLARFGIAGGLALHAYVTFRPFYAILAHHQGWIGGASEHPVFLELASATPNALLYAWGVECALLLAGSVQLVRRKASAVWLLGGAVVAFVVQHAIVRSVEAYGRIFADWQLNLEFLVLAVLTVMAFFAYRLTRTAPARAAA